MLLPLQDFPFTQHIEFGFTGGTKEEFHEFRRNTMAILEESKDIDTPEAVVLLFKIDKYESDFGLQGFANCSL
jgi:hypothetical protein